MMEFYVPIKLVHVAAALTSGGFFLLRGIGVQAGAGWPMAQPLRYLSYAIDIVLLSAALALIAVLPWAAFANGWLAVKLCLLVGYIVLGSFALKRGRTRRIRGWCFAAALLTYTAMLAVARSHQPLGPLQYLFS